MSFNNIDLTVPGSKSITNRALLIASLADGRTVLNGVCLNDDSRVFMFALQKLGFELSFDGDGDDRLIINGTGGDIPVKNGDVYVGSAGTAARFLTAMMALSDGCYEVSSSDQMKARPMRELLEALECLGAEFNYHEEEYSFPFEVKGRRFTAESSMPDIIPLNIDKSSQFLSALLLCGPMVQEGFTVELTGKRAARSYVEITKRMMSDFGCEMSAEGDRYTVPEASVYRCMDYDIEPDISSSCYFYACAAINKGRALVRGVHKDSMQGDISFIKLLGDIGFDITDTENGVILDASDTDINSIPGPDIDMSDFSDQTMTLACMAPFFSSPTTIRGIAHIRGQESDRIYAVVSGMHRLGIKAEELPDGVRVFPADASVLERYKNGEADKVIIESFNDHRVAMSFAILGTVLTGIEIDNPDCTAKTFPDFFEKLKDISA